MRADSSSREEPLLPWERARSATTPRLPHLVLAWSLDEPERVGESFRLDVDACLGRGEPHPDDPVPRATFTRMRPDTNELMGPITSARIGRLQLLFEALGPHGAKVQSPGRAVMRINGRPCKEGELRVGDILEIHNAAVFIVGHRPSMLSRAFDFAGFPFGAPDAFGIVGESEATWRMRSELAFAGSTDRHVLLLGESGTGKELAAKAVHGYSARASKPLVSRNAATMPESLLDAELFGNVRNYPNPGMPERAGLIGEADGSTLFLDEIGDLPESQQVHLLRVLDADGEHQRLGESKSRRSSFRLVAATNRPLESLKPDLLARFTHRVTVSGLSDRREDIPLLVSALLSRIVARTPSLAARFFERRGGKLAEPRLAPDFVARLLRHPFTHHVRELDRLLWLSIGTAEGDFIGLTPAVEAELKDREDASAPATAVLDRETLARALAESGGSPSKAAKALGLKNRYVLLRLLKKHGLSAATDDGEG
jgi:two-component system nitrogen regulation response regulator GlnG/two-component system response regulator HydG